MATATANIQARVAPEFKQELILAAEMEGLSLTDYLVRNLGACVKKTLQRDQIWKLNRSDSEKLVDALMGDARDIPALKSAAKRYKDSGIQ
ncbi:Uncharacterized conserved protein, DUF1778 family [Rubritalea squalenifaciens DSM 18772]|uniref:Uncharacterized conserved protein, DUF1778 family n=1 Tax=Rubritalea squalenifaciens DSM 18772 TaxID=1123071 RepID=A0A1M6DCC0_9BACT|nr:DUF1778 domain-containing protein [Rubritalea squalenifaciens]SHI70775.1 Uncharacterized conserved protein, DUF1778 family [Rubritalea squalenifaciens DSM 18772]